MKKLLYSLLLVSALVGCGPAIPTVSTKIPVSTKHSIQLGNFVNPITFYVIVIDGQEYLASQQSGGKWSLCPKLK